MLTVVFYRNPIVTMCPPVGGHKNEFLTGVRNTCEFFTPSEEYVRIYHINPTNLSHICDVYVWDPYPYWIKNVFVIWYKNLKKVNKILYRRKHHTNIRIDDKKCDDFNRVGFRILR